MKKTIKIFLHLFSITILASVVFLGGVFDRWANKLSGIQKSNIGDEGQGDLVFSKQAFADVSDGGGYQGGDCGVSDSGSSGDDGGGDDC